MVQRWPLRGSCRRRTMAQRGPSGKRAPQTSGRASRARRRLPVRLAGAGGFEGATARKFARNPHDREGTQPPRPCGRTSTSRAGDFEGVTTHRPRDALVRRALRAPAAVDASLARRPRRTGPRVQRRPVAEATSRKGNEAIHRRLSWTRREGRAAQQAPLSRRRAASTSHRRPGHSRRRSASAAPPGAGGAAASSTPRRTTPARRRDGTSPWRRSVRTAAPGLGAPCGPRPSVDRLAGKVTLAAASRHAGGLGAEWLADRGRPRCSPPGWPRPAASHLASRAGPGRRPRHGRPGRTGPAACIRRSAR